MVMFDRNKFCVVFTQAFQTVSFLYHFLFQDERSVQIRHCKIMMIEWGLLSRLSFSFQFQNNKGIDTDTSYPYKAVDGSCKYNAANKAPIAVNGIKNVLSKNETDLMVAVSIQPVSVAIDASTAKYKFKF
jgi:Papain family cysteine protease